MCTVQGIMMIHVLTTVLSRVDRMWDVQEILMVGYCMRVAAIAGPKYTQCATGVSIVNTDP